MAADDVVVRGAISGGSRSVILASALAFLQLAAGSSASGDLEKVVADYWNLLQAGHKSGALQYVSSQSRDSFLSRQEPRLRSWKLDGLEFRRQDRFLVTVLVERWTPAGYFEWAVKEAWVKEGGRWQVTIDDPAEARRALWDGIRPPVPGGLIDVQPPEVVLHFLSHSQLATLVIRNGGSSPLKLVGVEYDAERFELVERVSSVGPLSRGLLSLRYTGKETAKELGSEIAVSLQRADGETSRYTIPIIYNHVSPGARGLLGLTSSQAEDLNRGDPLYPRIAPPRPAAGPVKGQVRSLPNVPRS